MSLLYERVLKMLPRINSILAFYGHANKLQYNTGVAMQDNAAQQWW